MSNANTSNDLRNDDAAADAALETLIVRQLKLAGDSGQPAMRRAAERFRQRLTLPTKVTHPGRSPRKPARRDATAA